MRIDVKMRKSKYASKWWVKFIRDMNYFAFKYYWFNWLIFLTAVFLFIFWAMNLDENETAPCVSNKVLDKQITRISKALDACCNCKLSETDTIPEIDTTTPPAKPTPSPPPGSLNCETITHSGNDGVDTKTYVLGTKSGRVEIMFNMFNEPDKLEVFYENKIVASTFSVSGNVAGFVGSNNGTRETGTLSFNYKHNKDQHIKVILTGGNGTSWEYKIGCPK